MSLATQTFSFLFSVVVVVLFFSKKPGGISLSRAISDCGEWRGRKRERERSKFLVTTPLAAKHLSYYNDCSQVSSLFIFIPCRRQQSRSTIQQWDKFKPLSQLFCRWPQDPHLVLHAQSELNKKKIPQRKHSTFALKPRRHATRVRMNLHPSLRFKILARCSL